MLPQMTVLSWLPEIRDLVVQLITAGLGGAVVASTTFITSWYRRRQIEQRFPVSGSYLSFYEDTENGQRVIVPSVAEFEQRGKSVTITNQLPNGRSWTLEGTIMPGGHISGVYSADATYDQGVGSFYLRINGGDLDGMWSGYDHSNRITNSGRYWFRKMKAVSVRKANPDDVSDMLAISSSVFGYGYLNGLETALDRPLTSVLVSNNGKRVAGFCLSYLLPHNSLEAFLRGYQGPIPDDIEHAARSGKLGIIKTIAVDQRLHRRGIGSSLLSHAERELKEMGAEIVLIPAWVYRNSANIAGILKRTGYEFWFWDRTYWKSACEKKDFSCAKFDGQCNCSVAFYRHRL